MYIKELPLETINKIAAGEVVIDSASVVKELIENSIDANSTQINIDLIESGKKSIIVKDNGQGISKDDLINSIKRHATSKIFKEEDLFNISTMGFRGEALYSISSVSHFSLISKKEGAEEGFGIYVDEILDNENNYKKIIEEKNLQKITVDNKKARIKKAPINEGTKIIVDDLFYNIPVRKNFLANSTNLLKNIIDIVQDYSLINENIDFILTNTKNNKKIELINTKNKKFKKRISTYYDLNEDEIYEFETEKKFNEFDTNHGNHIISTKGMISSPYKTFSTRKVNIFINNRLVDYKLVQDAVYDAYKTFLFVNRHPFIFLNIRVNLQDLDVNIHPSKKEIKYRFESTLYNLIYEIVRKTLYENSKPKNVTSSIINNSLSKFSNEVISDNTNIEEKEDSIKVTDINSDIYRKHDTKKNNIDKNRNKEEIYYHKSNNFQDKLLKERKDNTEYSNQGFYNNSGKYKENFNNEFDISLKRDLDLNRNFKFNKIKIIGEFHNTYFFLEYNEELYILDQHALEERLNYEKNLKDYQERSIQIQELIEPIILELKTKEYISAIENIDKINKFGYSINDFGNNSIIIRTIPILLKKQSGIDILKELIENIDKKENNIEQLIRKTIISMSCKESIKANDYISNDYIKKIFVEALKLKNPYQCPHGRPTMIKYSLDDMEKMFKRK